MSGVRRYLVCYDIENTRVRTRVYKKLRSFGYRVQRSVFEVSILTKAQKRQLLEEIQADISETDSVRFYRLTRDAMADSFDLNEGAIKPPSATVIV